MKSAVIDKQVYSQIRSSEVYRMTHVHCHEEYELYFLLRGSVTYYIGDEIFYIKAGNFAFIPKGILHKTEYEADEDTERFVLYIRENSFTGEMQTIKDELCKCRVIYVENGRLDLIEKLFRQLEKEYQLEEEYQRLEKKEEDADAAEQAEVERRYIRMLINLHIRELLIQLNRYKSDYQPALSGADQLIYEISQYISAHFQEDLSLKKLSREFAMSESHLSRKFRANTGIGINEYITYVRINYAEMLMKKQRLPITRVAELCGFNDSNYFSTVFKKIKGITPGKYFRQFSEENQ